MKANEAPEKIYINSNLENRTWLIGKGDISFIEYVRTNAFIEKACSGIEKLLKGRVNDNLSVEIIEDFKSFMTL